MIHFVGKVAKKWTVVFDRHQQQATCIVQALVDQIPDVIADCAGVDVSAGVSCFFFCKVAV